jgi:hypothetical protein
MYLFPNGFILQNCTICIDKDNFILDVVIEQNRIAVKNMLWKYMLFSNLEFEKEQKELNDDWSESFVI